MLQLLSNRDMTANEKLLFYSAYNTGVLNSGIKCQ